MMLYFILQILILYNLSLQFPSACFVIIKQSFSAGKESYTKSYRKRKLYLSLITDVNIFHSSPISLKPSIVTFAISTFHYCFNKSSSQSFMLCLSVMVFYKDLAASWLFHFLSAVFSIVSLNQTVFHLYQYLHQ